MGTLQIDEDEYIKVAALTAAIVKDVDKPKGLIRFTTRFFVVEQVGETNHSLLPPVAEPDPWWVGTAA